ncbi:hypothetical protein D9M68_657710 [compost metagenome]
MVEQLVANALEVQRRRLALEHGAPVGPVGHLATQQVFDEAGLLAGGHAHDRQRLAGALVDPAGRHLAGAGDAHLDARGIGQVDHVIGHAEALAPLRLAAGALLEVALFRADDAAVALRQLGEAGVAVALAEALLRLAPAVGAMDGAEEFEAQLPADQGVRRDFRLVQAKAVLHGCFKAHRHLAQCAAS